MSATDGVTCDVAIVGAGAAGLATAIFAKRRAPALRIVVCESARRPGAKILVSGGGRCNVTNRAVAAADFWEPGSAAVRRVLKALPVAATVEFFRELGVTLHEEEHGKLFPDSNRARSVIEALLGELGRLGVALRCGERVGELAKLGEGFELRTANGRLRSRRVVLASGGRSLPKSGSDGHGYELARRLGHGLVPTTPALAPLVLEGGFHAGLSGVALPVELSVAAAGERPRRIAGDLLFTHFGVSGPAVLDASRFWHRARLHARAVEVTACFRPGLGFAAVEGELLELAAGRPRLSLAAALGLALPQALGLALLQALGLPAQRPLGQLGREERRRLVQALTAWPLPVKDSRGYNFAEVTAGGVPLAELNAGTLESRVCPGLYLVGEILDVDGRIGGFNFQWAWCSAFVAARALARAG